MKKEFKIRFTIIIVLGIIASVFYIQILLSHLVKCPFYNLSWTLTFINQSLIAPVFMRKAAEKGNIQNGRIYQQKE